MIKKVIVAISIILVVLLSSVGFLYAADNSNNKTYHVTASSNNGGTITPEGNQPVQKGDSITFNISIDKGYELAWLRIDNAKVKNFTDSSYTFDNVTKNHTIQAHFSKINNGNSNNKTFHVTASSNNGGTITPKGRQTVANGGSITFIISADSGYELEWLRIDNAKEKNFNASSYQFDKVNENHTIQAHFSKINNGNSNNSGGTITTEGNQPVQKGNGIASNISKFSGFFHNLFLKIFKHFRS